MNTWDRLQPADGDLSYQIDTLVQKPLKGIADGGRVEAGPYLNLLTFRSEDQLYTIQFRLDNYVMPGKYSFGGDADPWAYLYNWWGAGFNRGYLEITDVNQSASVISGRFDFETKMHPDSQGMRVLGVFKNIPMRSPHWDGLVDIVPYSHLDSVRVTWDKNENQLLFNATEQGYYVADTLTLSVGNPAIGSRRLETDEAEFSHTEYSFRTGAVTSRAVDHPRNDTLTITRLDPARRRISFYYTIGGRKVTLSDFLWSEK